MQLENRAVDAALVSKFDLDTFSSEALLFQSGYLTIAGKERVGTRIQYHLDYPNFGVQSSFNKGLAQHLTGRGREVETAGKDMVEALGANDFFVFWDTIQELLHDIPHSWHDSGGLGRYESWYASLLYMSFQTTRVKVKVEKASNRGRSDMVLQHENQVFVLEFKTVKDETKIEQGLDSAIAQIREKGYAEKYRNHGKPVHLIGMVFGRKEHNLLEIRVEEL